MIRDCPCRLAPSRCILRGPAWDGLVSGWRRYI